MKNYQLFIKDIFDRYKCKPPHRTRLRISVTDDQGQVCAHLRPITADFLESHPEDIELLSRWRRENPLVSPEMNMAFLLPYRDALFLGLRSPREAWTWPHVS